MPGFAVDRRGRAIGAYDELAATGALGDQAVAVLRRLAAQYTRSHSFPPPEGYSRWDDAAVDDLLGSLFADKGPAFVMACLVGASDDGSLERLLLATIANYLKDGAKGTERGKLRRRLRGLMTGDSRFTRVPGTESGIAGWTLAGGSTALSARSAGELQHAATSVRGVSITRWNTSGPTSGGTRHALLTVAEAVLAVANGAVRDEDLARAVETRFALLAQPQFVELKTDDLRHEPAAHAGDEPQTLMAVAEQSADLWRGLSPAERSLLQHLGEPDPVLAVIAGTGPKQARALAHALAEKIRLATLDDAQHDDVILALFQLSDPP